MIKDILAKNLNLLLTDKQIERLDKFYSLFSEYNSHTNLMSTKDVSFLFEKHIFDSLAFNLFKEKYLKEKEYKILDIGTGGGFPSIPLAIVYPGFKITALDSVGKKIKFIEHIQEQLNLKNLFPVCSRVEDLESDEKSSFDVVVSRAVSDLCIISEYALPFIKKEGFFIAYKSSKLEQEISESQKALKILGGSIIDKIEYNLPLEISHNRVLTVIQKKSETPLIYPRKNGLIKKKPL